MELDEDDGVLSFDSLMELNAALAEQAQEVGLVLDDLGALAGAEDADEADEADEADDGTGAARRRYVSLPDNMPDPTFDEDGFPIVVSDGSEVPLSPDASPVKRFLLSQVAPAGGSSLSRAFLAAGVIETKDDAEEEVDATAVFVVRQKEGSAPEDVVSAEDLLGLRWSEGVPRLDTIGEAPQADDEDVDEDAEAQAAVRRMLSIPLAAAVVDRGIADDASAFAEVILTLPAAEIAVEVSESDTSDEDVPDTESSESSDDEAAMDEEEQQLMQQIMALSAQMDTTPPIDLPPPPPRPNPEQAAVSRAAFGDSLRQLVSESSAAASASVGAPVPPILKMSDQTSARIQARLATEVAKPVDMFSEVPAVRIPPHSLVVRLMSVLQMDGLDHNTLYEPPVGSEEAPAVFSPEKLPFSASFSAMLMEGFNAHMASLGLAPIPVPAHFAAEEDADTV